MKLKKRANGYWYIYYDRRHSKGLRTKDQVLAKQLFEDERRRVREGKVVRLERAQRIRLSDFRKEYLAERQHHDVGPGTLVNDDRALRKLQEVVGDVPLRMVTRKKVSEFKARLLGLGKKKTYINVLLRSLRAAFNWAMIEDDEKPGYTDRNPFLKERGRASVLFDTGRNLPRDLDSGEIRALLASSEPDFRMVVGTALNTGARRTEIARLMITDVRLDEGVIRIRETKNREDREVPIADSYRGRLETYLQGLGADIGPLFPRWRHSDVYSTKFAALCRRAGVTARFHDLRHTFAMNLRRAGVPLDVIQKLLGHRNIQTTQIYAKVVDEELRSAVNKLRFGGDEGEGVIKMSADEA
jgi:integrase